MTYQHQKQQVAREVVNPPKPEQGGNGEALAPKRPTITPPVDVERPRTPEEIVENLRFMFAVGIECSNPLIAGNYRVDELETTGHYDNWRKDLRLVRGLGLKYL